MRLWRICRREYSLTALAGEGGLHFSGRWHHKGHRVVYSAQYASLAALETLVHFDPTLAPDDLVLVEIEAPSDVTIVPIEPSTLPEDWRETPAPALLQDIGTQWLVRRESPVLQVPSAIIATESNFLINPEHPHAKNIAIVSTAPFRFDSRLIPAT